MQARRLPFLLAGLLLTCSAAGASAGEAGRELSPKDLKITTQGVGPLRADTKATLGDVTRLLPGFDVESTTRKEDGKNTIVLLVGYVGQTVAEIITGAKDSVVAVRVVSADVPSPSEDLYVGGTLDDVGRLAACRLLGEKGAEGTACKVKGIDHIEFRFATAADAWSGTGIPPAEAMKGVKITAIEWQP